MKKSSALLLAAAFLFTAVALFYAWTNWAGARELRTAIAQLEKKKEPTRIEDFVPPPVPDDQNVAAAPIFRELFVSEKDSRLGKLIQPWKGTPVAGEKRLLQIAKEINPAFSGDEASAARVVMDSLSPSDLVLAELSEALRRPQISWPLDYSKGFEMPLPHIGPMMKASKMLQARALAGLAAGAPQKAFEDANTLLAMAEVSVSPHFTICELVRISILSMALDVINDGLSRSAWSDSNLASFSGSLAQKNLAGQMADAFRVERAMGQQWDWSDLKLLALLPAITGEKAAWTEHIAGIVWRIRPAGWVNRDRALHLLLMQRMIEALGDGGSISPAEFRDIGSLAKNVSLWGRLTTPLTNFSFPALDGLVPKAAFAQTLLECTRAAVAVERYRLANDRLPTHLADLVLAFLAAVPKDPLTGAPLLYKLSPEGSFVIYGTGWNQADDGGAVNSPQIDQQQKQADWGVSASKR